MQVEGVGKHLLMLCVAAGSAPLAPRFGIETQNAWAQWGAGQQVEYLADATMVGVRVWVALQRD